jgi:hypothetical protein
MCPAKAATPEQLQEIESLLEERRLALEESKSERARMAAFFIHMQLALAEQKKPDPTGL